MEIVPRQWKVIQHVREKISMPKLRGDQRKPLRVPPIERGRAVQGFWLTSCCQIGCTPAAQPPKGEPIGHAKEYKPRCLIARGLGRRLRATLMPLGLLISE